MPLSYPPPRLRTPLIECRCHTLPCDFELYSLNAGYTPSPLLLRLCTPLIECHCHTSHAASHSANRMLAIYPLPLPPQFSRPAHQMPLSYSFPCDLFISPIQCYCNTLYYCNCALHQSNAAVVLLSPAIAHSTHRMPLSFVLFCPCNRGHHALYCLYQCLYIPKPK